MSEVSRKIATLRQSLQDTGASGVVLRGVDYFAWATGGGNGAINLAREAACAELFVTEKGAWLLASEIEVERLRQEEVPAEWGVQSGPWQKPTWSRDFIADHVRGGRLLSDRPQAGEEALPAQLVQAKRMMCAEEIGRYQALGRDVARVARLALEAARPEWSEEKLAGHAASLLWERGIHPVLTLVGGEERSPLRRHPFPRALILGRRALLVICGRRHGLYANLSRWQNWGAPRSDEIEREKKLRDVEACAWEYSRPGARLGDIYRALCAAYARVGHAEEVDRHHQGGITGYLGREALALPGSHEELQLGMALAWNPSLPGAKVEDTVLIEAQGLRVLTRENFP